MTALNKRRLVELADVMLDDAKTLLRAGRSHNAYYLAGYAMEFMLKAIISSRFQKDTLPDPIWVNKIFSHKFEALKGLALLDDDLRDADAELIARWQIACEWSTNSRYGVNESDAAARMIEAIDDPTHGVLQWLRTRL